MKVRYKLRDHDSFSELAVKQKALSHREGLVIWTKQMSQVRGQGSEHL